MSNNESFIEEVTEEVRRDRLYALMRRYGWIAVVSVVALVGGTAYNEYRKSQNAATAQALGDAILQAAQIPDPEGRHDSLAQVEALTEGTALAPVALLDASAQFEAGDISGAIATLQPLTTDPDLPLIYRDIAAFRLVSQGADAIPADIRADLIDRISAPGAPLRLLGLEQSALFELEQGNVDAAVEILQGLVQEEGLTEAMLQRSAQLLAVLGADASSAIAQ